MSRIQVAVVDYGVGNLLSVSRALQACGADVDLTGDADRILRAERVVLPGVGAFGSCVDRLREQHLDEAVLQVIAAGRPLLGICVGMQMLLDVSDEFGEHRGLGVIPGRVVPVASTTADDRAHKIPHIGWAGVTPVEGGMEWPATAFGDIAPGTAFYFLHSFHAQPTERRHVFAAGQYNGRDICAAIGKDNIIGTQFHPEKSGQAGLALLSAFLAMK